MPEGTRFTVLLTSDVAAGPEGKGAPFRGSIRDPLLAPDGTVVVRRGAWLHGVVAPAGVRPSAVVAVDLTTVQTMDGEVPIAARLAGAGASPDPTAYDFVMPPAPAGMAVELVLTQPLVPVGSTYR